MVIKKEKFLKKAFYEQFGIDLQSCYFWSNLTNFYILPYISKYLVPQKKILSDPVPNPIFYII